MPASHLLMIRPVRFGYNPQTAVNNAFQEPGQEENAQEKAAVEFENFVALLRNNDVDVLVVQDTSEPHTPDAVFPNNWVSFHEDGTVCLYPMFAVNRRHERSSRVLEKVGERFQIKRTIDFSRYENDNIFLEGTGSLVLDHDHRIAYACFSPRTSREALEDFCNTMKYLPVVFSAVDNNDQAIYHTNVMMCVADRYVVICLDSIKDRQEQQNVVSAIKLSGKMVVNITQDQLVHFAGNMLQVQNSKGKKILVMSARAFHSLTPEQVQVLSSFNKIVYSPLDTIETNGGGSARCMIAEIYLPANADTTSDGLRLT